MSFFMTTERLGFRHWTAEDLPLALALWTDAGVMGHMGGSMSAGDVAERLALERTRQGKLGVQYWPMFSLASGEHAGCAGLRPFHDRAGLLELGVHVARPFWSARLGEEAARAVIAWAWQHTSAAALVAGHGPENVNSKALIERLGFVYTHHEPWGSQARMHPYYRLNRP
jgi:ribosomal-protein-alanine N-acetyltransferase